MYRTHTHAHKTTDANTKPLTQTHTRTQNHAYKDTRIQNHAHKTTHTNTKPRTQTHIRTQNHEHTHTKPHIQTQNPPHKHTDAHKTTHSTPHTHNTLPSPHTTNQTDRPPKARPRLASLSSIPLPHHRQAISEQPAGHYGHGMASEMACNMALLTAVAKSPLRRNIISFPRRFE